MITGASRGIGAAAARTFENAGARVVGLSRSTGCDVTDPAQVRRALAALPRIDVLIASAGELGPMVPLADYPLADWERVLRVNVTGVLVPLQAAAPKLGKDGVVLLLSSGAGRKPRAGVGAYGVSKAAVEALCQIAAAELPCRVVSVNPGPTRTAMRAAYSPAEDPATVKPPELAAKALLELARRGETGRAYQIGPDGSVS